MKVYPEYNHTNGSRWFTELPSHWRLIKAKRLFINVREKSDATDEQLAASQKFGIIPQTEMMKLNNAKVMLALKGTENFKKVHKDDFVISLRSFEGGIEHSSYNGCITPAYTVLRLADKESSPDYFKKALKCQPFIDALNSASEGIRDGKSISFEEFGELLLAVPSPSEQAKIACYLDRELSRIDALISEKQNFINLLEEKRQALISHVVTKGLDDNAKMTDSGVEWIGDVPAHWKVMRMKHVAKLNAGTKKKKLNDDEKIEFLPMSNVDEVAGEIRQFDLRNFAEVSSGYTAFQTNDVIFAKITPCMENGNCVIVPELKHGFGFGSTEFIVFRTFKAMIPEYLYLVLRNKELRKICETFMTGTAGQQRISTDFLAEFPVAVPSLEEQSKIVEYVRQSNARLYAIKQETQKSIELLKEHRSALISAAVTGKIDVREEV